MAQPFDGSYIQILYATDGCAITDSLMILSGQKTFREIYVVSYAWSEDLNDVFNMTPTGNLPMMADEDLDLSAGAGDGAQFSHHHLAAVLLEHGTHLSFCLLGGLPFTMEREGCKPRTHPVFFCRLQTPMESIALARAILYGDPLSTGLLLDCLDEERTFALHDDLILALAINTKQLVPRLGCTTDSAQYDPNPETSIKTLSGYMNGRRGLTSMYIHHEQAVLATFRRIYGINPTPFWFVAKFGPGEKTLVLATRYYLLQATQLSHTGACYDLQAVKDFICTYNVNVTDNTSGLDVSNLASFATFSRFCCQSGYARGSAAAHICDYIHYRITADISEISTLGEYIAADRQSLRISDGEFITYIYLAHFESFNHRQVRDHLRSVTLTDIALIKDVVSASSLKRSTIENFFSHIRAQLHISNYISQCVNPHVVVINEKLGRVYAASKTYPSLTAQSGGYIGMCDVAGAFIKLIDGVENSIARRGWPCNITSQTQGIYSQHDYPSGDTTTVSSSLSRRLLHLVASTSPSEQLISPVNVLLGRRDLHRPIPVYRISLPEHKQAFAVIHQDDWSIVTRRIQSVNILNLLPESLKNITDEHTAALRDAYLTHVMHQRLDGSTSGLASSIPSSTMYINRNEIFNGGLLISNIILDIDFCLKQPIPLPVLHTAMRGFRAGVIEALSLLLSEAVTDWTSHPCYFYKTSCPPQPRHTICDIESQDINEIQDFMWDADIIEQDLTLNELHYEGAYDLNFKVSEDVVNMESKEQLGKLDTAYVCGCTEKLGFRVAIPIPPPYLFFGSDTLKGMARIIQQAVMIERTFAETMYPYLKDFSFIDTGVYGHGHSLRLPFFSKVGDGGLFNGLLLPFYVVPIGCKDLETFLYAHTDPNNFHFHAMPAYETPTHILTGLGGEYLSFFERKAASHRTAALSGKTSLRAALQKLHIQPDSPESIETFITDIVLDTITGYIRVHFPDYDTDYQAITVRTVVLKPEWILLQVVRTGCYSTRMQGFQCLRYKHMRGSRNSARTFVALSVDTYNRVCASLSQQCFATKCGNNKFSTIFTVEVASTC
ncbi:helicase-primase primase subunit [Felid alphaherpesvirus 1]|nr:helicase-primase primase subunit [Felid alphaherpesvirus 1]